MSMISGSIKDILSIKIKHRHDGCADQFSRIFMVKMFLISSLVMSIEFFNDTVSCILPDETAMSKEFVHSACWIQGFYIYKELRYQQSEMGYYGMPKDVQVNGISSRGELCRVKNQGSIFRNSDCFSLTKTYFLQYQYFPFYIASLGILYYLPYILYRVVNSDVISLRTNLKASTGNTFNAAKVLDRYFTYTGNGGILVLRLRIIATIGIKLSYVFVNIGGFLFTDNLLNNEYTTYGIDWIKWAQFNNSAAFGHGVVRGFPKPGNALLPSMGFCDIMEGSKDIRSAVINEYKIICEISTHILYQYVLIVLWFLFVMGIVIATSGLLQSIGSHGLLSAKSLLSSRRKQGKPTLYKACRRMTFREMEYMKIIRSKDLSLYKEVLRILQLGEHV